MYSLTHEQNINVEKIVPITNTSDSEKIKWESRWNLFVILFKTWFNSQLTGSQYVLKLVLKTEVIKIKKYVTSSERISKHVKKEDKV